MPQRRLLYSLKDSKLLQVWRGRNFEGLRLPLSEARRYRIRRRVLLRLIPPTLYIIRISENQKIIISE